MRKRTHIIILTILCTLALYVLPALSQTPSPTPYEDKCECFRLDVESSSESVKAGQQVVFRATLTSENADAPTTFQWEVKGGQIVDGQETKTLIAIAEKSDERLLTATLILGGEHKCMRICPFTASESVKILAIESMSDLLSFSYLPDDPHGFIYSFPSPRPDKRRSVPQNQNPNVDALELDHAELTSICAPDAKAKGDCSESLEINVKTTATDADDDILVYHYTVSGGKIVGQGVNVKWDLSDVKPGKYTITAGVDDGCGVCGKTATKEVTVKEFDRTVKQNAPELESVTFSDDAVILPCIFRGQVLFVCSEEGPRIKISSKVKNPGSDLEYYYVPTGGRIVGTGSDVIWEFDGVRPHKYELTVGIGKDRVIFGKTITKSIDAKECECHPPKCECPTISIIGPKGPVKVGSTVMFQASVAGGDRHGPVTYKWTVSNGTIVSGNTSAYLLVKASSATVGEIEVKLELGGGLCDDCPLSTTEAFPFAKSKSK